MEEPGRSENWRTVPHMGIYGWRKRCLYLLILTLLVLVILNLALTLWVLRVMEFNTEGMGNIRIVDGGLEVQGQSYILGSLVASSIRSKPGRSLQMRASHNISISSDHHLSNSIALGNDIFQVKASRFKVSDHQGRSLFVADKNELSVGADTLKLSGPGGIVIDGSLQTSLVRANPGSDLSLESPTRDLQILAPSGVSIESRAGNIRATCLTDFKLESMDGEIRLDGRIIIPGLKTAQARTSNGRSSSGPVQAQQHQVYQLCSCQNGKLFLAPSDGICSAASESNICR